MGSRRCTKSAITLAVQYRVRYYTKMGKIPLFEAILHLCSATKRRN